jgi:hypothetical protein
VIQAAGRIAVREVRRLHELREPDRTQIQHRPRSCRRQARRRRHPLRLRPSS